MGNHLTIVANSTNPVQQTGLSSKIPTLGWVHKSIIGQWQMVGSGGKGCILFHKQGRNKGGRRLIRLVAPSAIHIPWYIILKNNNFLLFQSKLTIGKHERWLGRQRHNGVFPWQSISSIRICLLLWKCQLRCVTVESNLNFKILNHFSKFNQYASAIHDLCPCPRQTTRSKIKNKI